VSTIAYAPALRECLRPDYLMPLGPAAPNRAAEAALRALRPATMFAPQPVRSPDAAQACLAALWLLHDFADESHQISQDLHTVEGSYWHAILHRREPDYGNAKYWFRRVGRHAVFEPLRAEAVTLSGGAAAAKSLVERSAWDPFAFIDLCERAAEGDAPLRDFCRGVQQREWELLFEYCYRQAIGEGPAAA
jgi:hypothetical protein